MSINDLIATSSVHAFRRMPHGVTVDESIPFAPDSPAGAYDRTKAEGTLAVTLPAYGIVTVQVS